MKSLRTTIISRNDYDYRWDNVREEAILQKGEIAISIPTRPVEPEEEVDPEDIINPDEEVKRVIDKTKDISIFIGDGKNTISNTFGGVLTEFASTGSVMGAEDSKDSIIEIVRNDANKNEIRIREASKAEDGEVKSGIMSADDYKDYRTIRDYLGGDTQVGALTTDSIKTSLEKIVSEVSIAFDESIESKTVDDKLVYGVSNNIHWVCGGSTVVE